MTLLLSELLKDSKSKVEGVERTITLQQAELDNTKKNLSEDTKNWLLQHEKLQVGYQTHLANTSLYSVLLLVGSTEKPWYFNFWKILDHWFFITLNMKICHQGGMKKCGFRFILNYPPKNLGSLPSLLVRIASPQRWSCRVS